MFGNLYVHHPMWLRIDKTFTYPQKQGLHKQYGVGELWSRLLKKKVLHKIIPTKIFYWIVELKGITSMSDCFHLNFILKTALSFVKNLIQNIIGIRVFYSVHTLCFLRTKVQFLSRVFPNLACCLEHCRYWVNVAHYKQPCSTKGVE